MKENKLFKLGLLINPMAGLGGSVGLKGSDGAEIVKKALALGAKPMASQRTEQALSVLIGKDIEIYTYPAEMGADIAKTLGFTTIEVGEIDSGATTSADTERAVLELLACDIDLLLFAGGDGTARNIANVVQDQVSVLGIPAGVKIHSGVYAITPKAAGEIVALLVEGNMLTLGHQEVRDIDEEAFREGRVKAKYYGELQVPSEHRYLQNVKSSGKEVEELVIADIAADVVEQMEDDTYYIIGSGTTVQAVMHELQLDNTLLGVDLVKEGKLVAKDCTASELLALTENGPTKIIITIIGGQGHIIGRGNQQLSAQLLEQVGKENLIVLATKTKLKELNGRPLICDSISDSLNQKFSGVIAVTTGYHDKVLYRIATP
ncbi:MAG: putative polyphosphate/ATP-dependent NAD kinase [Oceanospirillaceae bacterium]|jgi:predicted polyphosphate/ATP-dependent NAD kinase